jgi:hypothetical protein
MEKTISKITKYLDELPKIQPVPTDLIYPLFELFFDLALAKLATRNSLHQTLLQSQFELQSQKIARGTVKFIYSLNRAIGEFALAFPFTLPFSSSEDHLQDLLRTLRIRSGIEILFQELQYLQIYTGRSETPLERRIIIDYIPIKRYTAPELNPDFRKQLSVSFHTYCDSVTLPQELIPQQTPRTHWWWYKASEQQCITHALTTAV